MARTIIINPDLHAALAAEKAATVPQSVAGLYASEALCAWQRRVSQRGILEAELVESAYGWSLRYASGLQDFGLIVSARAKQVDGSYADAVAFAERWVAVDPTRRFVSANI